jgi:A/G-specific adenine glycosylase
MQRITAKKICGFQSILLYWYKQNGRRFPWRKKNLTHYQLILAEALLQRTKAETVARFYDNFIREFPNWVSISKAKLVKIENRLKPIGLFKQRAKRLKKLAAEMVSRNGRLPRSRLELEKIPFLGQYIANAIELTIFNMRSPLIDVNMARLLERFFGERKMSDIRYDPYLQKLSHNVVNHPMTKEMNWAILDFASTICKARNPLHGNCPLNKKCSYYGKMSIFMSRN